MQPYQEASEAIRSGNEFPIHIAKNAALTYAGGGIASAGAKAASKLIPKIGSLINKYIPDKLMAAGLAKLDPRFKKFIQGAVEQGYSMEDIRSFLGEKTDESAQESPGNAENPQESTKNPKDNRNIIEQYSPELHQFIDQEVKKGRKPLEAGAIAQNDKRFKDVINKISKDHKTPWSSILESVYGALQSPNANQQSQSIQEPQQGQPAQAQGDKWGQIGQALKDVLNS